MENEINGRVPTVGASVLYTLSSGLDVEIQLLTPVILQRINDKAAELWPLPDKAEYEKPLQNALPGTTGIIPAEQNPDYVQAYANAVNGRSQYLLDMLLRLAVRAKDEAGIIAYHQTFVDEARKTGVLVENEDDTPLLIVLRNFAATVADFNNIVAIAQRRLPLGEAEIVNGRAYFQCIGLRPTAQRVDTHKTPRTNGKAPHEKERVSP